jgi:hypothetical protein
VRAILLALILVVAIGHSAVADDNLIFVRGGGGGHAGVGFGFFPNSFSGHGFNRFHGQGFNRFDRFNTVDFGGAVNSPFVVPFFPTPHLVVPPVIFHPVVPHVLVSVNGHLVNQNVPVHGVFRFSSGSVTVVEQHTSGAKVIVFE